MADPIVGGLLPAREGYPPAQQPGGVGTKVIPTQPVPVTTQGPTPTGAYPPAVDPTPSAEQASMFFPGCGHAIRSWQIARAAIGGVPSALVTCPLCGWVQSVRSPFNLLDLEEIILGVLALAATLAMNCLSLVKDSV